MLAVSKIRRVVSHLNHRRSVVLYFVAGAALSCGGDEPVLHLSGYEACVMAADEFASKGTECGYSYESIRIGFIEGASDGQDCTAIIGLENEFSFRTMCLPAIEAMSCADFESMNLPPSCRDQFILSSSSRGESDECLMCPTVADVELNRCSRQEGDCVDQAESLLTLGECALDVGSCRANANWDHAECLRNNCTDSSRAQYLDCAGRCWGDWGLCSSGAIWDNDQTRLRTCFDTLDVCDTDCQRLL